MNPEPPWSEESVTMLRRMWREGFSASCIAGEIPGVTRNAVIGKIRRLGIASEAPERKLAAPRKPRRVVSRKPPDEPALEPFVPPPDGGRNIIELRSGECRFPVGERDGAHLFCGARTRFGSWCEAHRAVVFRAEKG